MSWRPWRILLAGTSALALLVVWAGGPVRAEDAGEQAAPGLAAPHDPSPAASTLAADAPALLPADAATTQPAAAAARPDPGTDAAAPPPAEAQALAPEPAAATAVATPVSPSDGPTASAAAPAQNTAPAAPEQEAASASSATAEAPAAPAGASPAPEAAPSAEAAASPAEPAPVQDAAQARPAAQPGPAQPDSLAAGGGRAGENPAGSAEAPAPAAESKAPATAPVAADIPPPDLPPAPVVVDVPARNPIAVALEARLASPTWSGERMAQLGKADRERLAAFYAERGQNPLFVGLSGINALGQAVLAQIATADADGMDPAAYPTPSMLANSPDSAAETELVIAASAFAYARDARGGRIEPSRLSHLITPDLSLPSPAEVLQKLAASADPGATLAAYQPQHAGYKALKEKLAELRESTAAIGRTAMLAGPVLRPGASDTRVQDLRARLDLPQRGDDIYDDALAGAVRRFQRANGLRPTGILDSATAHALSAPRHPSISAADIIANMERWRWLPTDLGERHIEVNLPEYTLRVFSDGKVIHQARVVIGKPQTPTPLFSNAMQHVIVNPYWHVPPSILKKEILPKLAEDPDYAAKHGYQVVMRGGKIAVQQPPGERNALGLIKFIFPNQHSVYLHDTPSRNLFAADKRAFSHGCVRVDQPFSLAQVVLADAGYDEARIRKLVGKGERLIKLREPLPIHLTYFTVFVDGNGHLQRREDLYGYDGRVRTALGLDQDGRRYAVLR